MVVTVAERPKVDCFKKKKRKKYSVSLYIPGFLELNM